MAAIGALAGTIGIDIYDGTERYTFGFQYLREGLHLVPLAMGLFGLSEVIASIRGSDYRPRHDVRLRAMLPTAREWKRSILATLRGAGYGCFFGPLPGTGRSEEHTSELQSLMRISYAVFCLKKKKHRNTTIKTK